MFGSIITFLSEGIVSYAMLGSSIILLTSMSLKAGMAGSTGCIGLSTRPAGLGWSSRSCKL